MFEKLHVIEQRIFDICAVLLVAFYSYSALISPAATQYHRGFYILVTYVLIFMLYKLPGFLRLIDYLLIIASIVCIGYWMIEFENINYRMGIETPLDKGIAVVGVLLGIELARRVVGIVFVIIGAVFLIYGVYGHMAPELISHSGASFLDLSTSIFYKSDGLFGIMADVLATYVILFVIFGAFLEQCGAQKFFIDLPLAAFGHKTGGAGKVAICASALFGSISGSAIANVVSTGTFTIPLMKKSGFKPEVAGAIEPAASIGGMFLPPIMGAGGFVMAELTGVPYSQIMLVSLFPACMYFFSVFVMVHFEAKKHNIKGEKSPYSAMDILKKEWYYALPLVVITVLMLMGYSPSFAAVSGAISCIIISWLDVETRMYPKHLVIASRKGIESGLTIGATVGIIGIIIGVLSFSGLVITFADIIIGISAGSKVITIFLIAVASLILGMGVPVTAAYIITAVVAVPALTELGVNELAAHMIVYWLSQDSNITPPVCIAAFTGATIAKANMWLTALYSFKFAKFLYLAPFLFGFVPEFSLDGSNFDIFKVFVIIAIGTWAYSYFLSFHWISYLKRKLFTKPV